MIHMAGLTNTPIIGLYGPFDCETRMKYYNSAVGISSKVECSPCNRHQPLAWCKWTSGESLCLKQLEPNLIIQELFKLI
jgi:ADP-heptose:LPS heptosyltransferase